MARKKLQARTDEFEPLAPRLRDSISVSTESEHAELTKSLVNAVLEGKRHRAIKLALQLRELIDPR